MLELCCLTNILTKHFYPCDTELGFEACLGELLHFADMHFDVSLNRCENCTVKRIKKINYSG